MCLTHTRQASSAGLAQIVLGVVALKLYCGIAVDKQYQLAELKNKAPARQDTRYLIWWMVQLAEDETNVYGKYL